MKTNIVFVSALTATLFAVAPLTSMATCSTHKTQSAHNQSSDPGSLIVGGEGTGIEDKVLVGNETSVGGSKTLAGNETSVGGSPKNAGNETAVGGSQKLVGN